MTRRVLEIVGSLASQGEGATMSLVAAGLDRTEFDVDVCALEAGPLGAELEQSGIAPTIVAQGRRFQPAEWWRLRQAIARLRPDVVHVWPGAGAAGRSAALLAGVGRVIIGQQAPRASEPWYAPLALRQLAARAAMMIVDCPAVAGCWAARGWPTEKIRTIAPGVPPATAGDRTRGQVLDELGLPGSSKLLAVAGPLELCERVKDLIWATDLLKVIRDDAHLLVIGGGPHRQRLERYTRLCQMRDKVHFVGCRADLASLMPHVNLVWRASSRPGLPIEIMRAMAAGIPTVAAEAPGMSELVIHEQTGYLVPIGDRAGLARYANKILQQPEPARRLGTTARERIATQFAPQAMAARHAAVYREVCG